MIELREKALSGIYEEAATMNLGIYPQGYEGSYSERTEWMEGWNAAVMCHNDYVLEIYKFLGTLHFEHRTLVEDLLLEGRIELSVGNDDGVQLMVNCSDVFSWGCGDCETIGVAELPDLQECYQLSPKHGGELWVSRRRSIRPQGAIYEGIPQPEWVLFDDCGPKRDVGLGNPHEHPGDKDV